jgi:hypothetical protein
MHRWRSNVFISLACQLCVFHFAAAQDFRAELLKLTTRSDSLSNARPAEKLYLQFDKPYYTVGDTVWFKAYVLNGASLTATDKSGLLYIDLVTDSGKTAGSFRFQVTSGLSWGDIVIDDKAFSPGSYTLYAYTNWMRNFGSDYFFSKKLQISASISNTVLTNTAFTTTVVNAETMLNARLQFSRLDETPLAAVPVQLKVLNGNRTLYRQKVLTGVDGLVNLDFALPPKTSGLTILATTDKVDRFAVIPVSLNLPANIDVQLMPEGGNMVAGLPAHIGVKAISEEGRGLAVSGEIVDQNQRKIVPFSTTHLGMGSLNLNPDSGQTYYANISLPGGAVRQYALPPVKNSGTLLRVKNGRDADSLLVTIAASNDLVKTGANYYLVAKARDMVCYAAIINFKNFGVTTEHIPKSLFPTGIVHLTLMTTQYRPLNERQVFIDHQDNLQITVTTNKVNYKPGDSVSVKIRVTDKQGKPVKADVSAAITDDGQVKRDFLNDENILSRLLLTADLKGYVESPGYYFSKNAGAWQALDDLLLTQGWIGYYWAVVASPPTVQFPAEPGLEVHGRVGNLFDNPVKGTHVTLFSKSPLILMDTVTDEKGRFVFNHFPRVDTPIFVIKAVNKRGKSANIGLTVDETPTIDLSAISLPVMNPWYVNADSTLINYTKTNAKQQDEVLYKGSEHMLKAVNIVAVKIIKDSKNLNGPGEADVVIDEKEIEKAGHQTLLQFLQANVKGFHDGYVPKTSIQWYFIHDMPVIMLVDGIRVMDMYQRFDFLTFQDYLETHEAGDIKGIEVIYAGRYSGAYDARYYPRKPNVFCFIEITSRGGHGPVISYTPGMYLYKPLPISWPVQFYKPRYTVKNVDKSASDLRSTIDWEPNIITDANGEGSFWFYTAGRKGSYSVVVEGVDLKGGIGYGEGTIGPPAP